MFDHISKRLEVRQKYSATRCIFNSLLGGWKGSQTRSLVFDILLVNQPGKKLTYLIFASPHWPSPTEERPRVRKLKTIKNFVPTLKCANSFHYDGRTFRNYVILFLMSAIRIGEMILLTYHCAGINRFIGLWKTTNNEITVRQSYSKLKSQVWLLQITELTP